MPPKITGKESEETLDIVQLEVIQKPERVTHDALKPEHTQASTTKPGLVSKDKDIGDMGTETDLQEMMEESKSKPIEREMVRQSGVGEDQQRASFLAAVSALHTSTAPQEHKTTVH